MAKIKNSRRQDSNISANAITRSVELDNYSQKYSKKITGKSISKSVDKNIKILKHVSFG